MIAESEAVHLYRQRQQRLADAIALRIPDRVPVIYHSAFWHAAYAGRTVREAMFDYDLLAELWYKAVLDLQPDGVASSYTITAVGPMLEAIGYRPLKWPGHGVGDNSSYQYLDLELMRPDEYDLYCEDPSYFYWSRFLPRIADSLAPLAKLPQFPSTQHLRLLASFRCFADPEIAAALARLAEVGAEARRMMESAGAFVEKLSALGFPSAAAGICPAPFDYFADYMRGSKGIMLDMYRRKDKLLAAMDHIVPMLVRTAVESGTQGPCNIIFMPMHWGLEGFMSLEQFKTFFWPQLRRVMMGMIEQGVVPCVLWEGQCASRLETMADIPPGKVIYWFERTDLCHAKRVLAGVACVRGNVPPSLLNTGTPDEVTKYCRRLIEGAGQGGGLIVDGAIGIPDEALPANVAAMFRAVHEYGCYR